jgi:hypothetical protein
MKLVILAHTLIKTDSRANNKKNRGLVLIVKNAISSSNICSLITLFECPHWGKAPKHKKQ